MGSKESAIKTPTDSNLAKNASHETRCDNEGYKRNVFCGAGPAGPMPTYVERSCESKPVLKNKYGSYICMGKDNMGARTHGYGGKGDTNCAAIDMVVGRGSCKKVGDKMLVDPLPLHDAARIYISQKSDIDEYFGLPEGSVGNSKARSAVIIKADAVRVAAREGIKIITGVASKDERNSQGGVIARKGIDLIAMYSDGLDKKGAPLLQPLVKGENLRAALIKIVSDIDSLSEMVGFFLSSQIEFNGALATHFSISPFFGAPTLANPTLIPAGIVNMKNAVGKSIPDLIKNKLMFLSVKSNYLRPSGASYILSKFNNTN